MSDTNKGLEDCTFLLKVSQKMKSLISFKCHGEETYAII